MIVRLKDVIDIAHIGVNKMFQFYDSPIKSPCVLENPECYSSFNSMIVRLKAPQKAQASYFSSSFNSMIVRLKARCSGQLSYI